MCYKKKIFWRDLDKPSHLCIMRVCVTTANPKKYTKAADAICASESIEIQYNVSGGPIIQTRWKIIRLMLPNVDTGPPNPAKNLKADRRTIVPPERGTQQTQDIAQGRFKRALRG
jgi:hypothetical protein